jgi:hypothetical protein
MHLGELTCKARVAGGALARSVLKQSAVPRDHPAGAVLGVDEEYAAGPDHNVVEVGLGASRA